jgi:hypothetical protein
LPWFLADLLMSSPNTRLTPESSKAFDYAQDVTKQLITLATGITALTVTFIHELVASASASAIHFVEAAWLCYVVSIAFGVITLLQLAGNLEKQAKPSIYRSGITLASLGQITLFVAGTACVIVFGIKAHRLAPA